MVAGWKSEEEKFSEERLCPDLPANGRPGALNCNDSSPVSQYESLTPEP
jgi:hypothetical protein